MGKLAVESETSLREERASALVQQERIEEREDIERKLEAIEEEQQQAAAVRVQARFRGLKARALKKGMLAAVVDLKLAQEKELELREEQARLLAHQRELEEEDRRALAAATTRIQARFRGLKARAMNKGVVGAVVDLKVAREKERKLHMEQARALEQRRKREEEHKRAQAKAAEKAAIKRRVEAIEMKRKSAHVANIVTQINWEHNHTVRHHTRS